MASCRIHVDARVEFLIGKVGTNELAFLAAQPSNWQRRHHKAFEPNELIRYDEYSLPGKLLHTCEAEAPAGESERLAFSTCFRDLRSASTMSTATILDVARKAKVSAGTVSRVINRHPSVDGQIALRVQQAIKALNYSPRQRKATLLALNPLEGKNVLLLMLGMDRSLASLPVVASARHGIEQAVGAAKANLLVADIPDADHVPDVLLRKRLDGVILKGALQGNLAAKTDPALMNVLRQMPSVWVLGRPQGCQGDVVQVNDTLAGQLAAEYLISHGHCRLAFVSPKPSQVSLMRRQASFTAASRFARLLRTEP